MTDEIKKAKTAQVNPATELKKDADSIHLVSLSITLQDLARKISAVEEKLDGNQKEGTRKATILEFCKVVFGGWPALGFLFLLLFYSPIRQALNAIPEKVKSAQEIGVLGMSLKSIVQVEAAKQGEHKLSETIPQLSSAAIELLFHAPRLPTERVGLISYRLNDQEDYRGFSYPSPSIITAMTELQAQGLCEIETEEIGKINGIKTLTGAGLSNLISQIQQKNPGKEEKLIYEEGEMTWIFNKPIPNKTEPIYISWGLTDLGKKAEEIILKAVSSELAPKAPESSGS